MKIEIQPTGKFEAVNGMQCRVWQGTSDKGVPVVVYVALVRADHHNSSPAQIEEFDRELREVKVDRHLVSFDMRLI